VQKVAAVQKSRLSARRLMRAQPQGLVLVDKF
jgi:hypothetical protein